MYDRSTESAGSLKESISEALQPGTVHAVLFLIASLCIVLYIYIIGINQSEGDTKATTRRLSDTPSNTQANLDWVPIPHGGIEDQEAVRRQEQEQQGWGGKSILQRAQETVAKALGGGSRGWASFLFWALSSLSL